MKRTVSLCITALLSCLLTCPALAADARLLTPTLYPTEVNEYASGEEMRLERTYCLSPTDDPASIPVGDFDREGWHYTLLDVTRQENSKSDEKDYAETYTLNMDTKDMEKIMPQLAAERTVTTEDGYTGTLVLDTSSIKVEAAGYNTSTKTVTATRTYPNLSDADISFVPKSITDNGRTMELADVQWQESDGFYHASATYTGKVSNKYATGLYCHGGLFRWGSPYHDGRYHLHRNFQWDAYPAGTQCFRLALSADSARWCRCGWPRCAGP